MTSSFAFSMNTSVENSEAVLAEAMRNLAKEKHAVILAHYYQRPEIQMVADFVGDSLDLARKAKETDAEIIVFAGVRFMAETAKILNPEKKVVLPDMEAGCSLDDNCPSAQFREFKAQYPDHFVVSYINCSAEVKAMSDVICTSSNAVRIIEQIPKDQPILFAPDANLGRYLRKQTGRDMVLWPGACEVHVDFSLAKLEELKSEYPDAELIAHPESEETILQQAEFIGSTRKLIDHVKENSKSVFIVATEGGILFEMKKQAPDKILLPAPATVNNACACSECRFMKKNTLEKLYSCLAEEKPAIYMNEALRQKALIPLERMFAWS